MRIAIREQLVLLVTFTVLVALAVVALPTWFFVHRFVIDVRKDSLALTASLKASKVTADLELVRSNIRTIASRLLIQKALKEWYSFGKGGQWETAKDDLRIALSARSQTGLLQAKIYSRDDSREPVDILSVTGQNTPSIELPYKRPNGSAIFLNDESEDSFPKDLYPNITYEQTSAVDPVNNLPLFDAFAFGDVPLNPPAGMLLGPLPINESFALMSVTLPIRDNDNIDFNLGFLTVVASATSLINGAYSPEGLGDTGMVLIVGPNTQWNRFSPSAQPSNDSARADKAFKSESVRFVLPPIPPPGQAYRHSKSKFEYGSKSGVFTLGSYPAALASLGTNIDSIHNASSILSTKNEEGADVAVGFARTKMSLVNWTIIVEQAREEAYRPIVVLRKILLGCVFGTAGVIFALTYPCAHLGVMPIRRLKSATEKSIAPPGYEDGYFDHDFPASNNGTPSSGPHSRRSRTSQRGWLTAFLIRRGLRSSTPPPSSGRKDDDESPESARRIFKIPGKVADKKHMITDELTELTRTFNDMSDELVRQYTSLDDKVAKRTRELEVSKKAAEAANESKTLFIANISHELKTPLNGILGMCAVCMEEDDVDKIKQSLRTLYKSGDLLLHLLEDLLSFSKNQIGQQLNLEQKEFGLADIRSQILTIFDKQVRENNIHFSVQFLNADSVEMVQQSANPGQVEHKKMAAIGPQGTGRLKDMRLWGDQHRILQVIINLVSNSLKFTPKGGRVDVRIKCVGEVEQEETNTGVSRSGSGTGRGSRSSSATKSSGQGSRHRHVNSTSTRSGSSRHNSLQGPIKGTALTINPMENRVVSNGSTGGSGGAGGVAIRGRSPTPPPANAKTYLFEFEVEDTGPGIKEEMQQRVFEPFMQGDPGLSKKFGGTGLGLSICQQLANLMGGVITLRSTVGVGSVFTMEIPLRYVKDRPSSTASSSMHSRSVSLSASESDSRRDSTSKPPVDNSPAAVLDPQPRLVGLRQPFFASNRPPPHTAGPHAQTAEAKMETVKKALNQKAAKEGPGGKLRVLVADDNSTNIEVVSKMLKLEDVYDVTIAKDGQEAYDHVKAAMAEDMQFDVIFMDVQMPNLDGLQSTRLIREMGYKSPIVALTAFSEESNVKECMESGMDEFLSKPIRRPALKQVLQKFATIPEEPESSIASTVSRKTDDEGETEADVDAVDTPGGDVEEGPLLGGMGGEKDVVEVREEEANGTPTPLSPP